MQDRRHARESQSADENGSVKPIVALVVLDCAFTLGKFLGESGYDYGDRQVRM